jgi:hypothetical protein
LCDELHIRSAALSLRLSWPADHVRLDGGDHVDHWSGGCSSPCRVQCLGHRVLDSRGRTSGGHPAQACYLPASICVRAECPDRRPRAAQKILSSGTIRWASSRMALGPHKGFRAGTEETWLPERHSRRQLLANAAIAASRVGSEPCAARRISPLWPLAHIHRRLLRGAGRQEDARPTDAVLQYLVVIVAPLAG